MTKTIEEQIQEKGMTAPRITPERIETVCNKAPQYHVFEGTTVTVCCLELANGFNVVGHSAAASPENFDREIGERIALENAKRQVWALEGYLLRQRLADFID